MAGPTRGSAGLRRTGSCRGGGRSARRAGRRGPRRGGPSRGRGRHGRRRHRRACLRERRRHPPCGRRGRSEPGDAGLGGPGVVPASRAARSTGDEAPMAHRSTCRVSCVTGPRRASGPTVDRTPLAAPGRGGLRPFRCGYSPRMRDDRRGPPPSRNDRHQASRAPFGRPGRRTARTGGCARCSRRRRPARRQVAAPPPRSSPAGQRPGARSPRSSGPGGPSHRPVGKRADPRSRRARRAGRRPAAHRSRGARRPAGCGHRCVGLDRHRPGGGTRGAGPRRDQHRSPALLRHLLEEAASWRRIRQDSGGCSEAE